MSIVLKNIDLGLSKGTDNENLVPVSDDELAEIIDEIGDALVAEIEEAAENAELPPEMIEILNAETFEERIRLYNKYHHIIFPEE